MRQGWVAMMVPKLPGESAPTSLHVALLGEIEGLGLQGLCTITSKPRSPQVTTRRGGAFPVALVADAAAAAAAAAATADFISRGMKATAWGERVLPLGEGPASEAFRLTGVPPSLAFDPRFRRFRRRGRREGEFTGDWGWLGASCDRAESKASAATAEEGVSQSEKLAISKDGGVSSPHLGFIVRLVGSYPAAASTGVAELVVVVVLPSCDDVSSDQAPEVFSEAAVLVEVMLDCLVLLRGTHDPCLPVGVAIPAASSGWQVVAWAIGDKLGIVA